MIAHSTNASVGAGRGGGEIHPVPAAANEDPQVQLHTHREKQILLFRAVQNFSLTLWYFCGIIVFVISAQKRQMFRAKI